MAAALVKQLVVRLQGAMSGLLLPVQVGYHSTVDSPDQPHHYHQDGYISALMTFLVLVAFGISATFGHILSAENFQPVKGYSVEIALSLYLALGAALLLLMSFSKRVRNKMTSQKRKKITNAESVGVWRERVLKYLPISGLVVFIFGVWGVDLLRIYAYADCMDEYRSMSDKDLHNEGAAAIFLHIIRLLFSASLVLFALRYQKQEVVFYRSVRMRFMFAMVMSAVFWMWLDAQLHHAHEVFTVDSRSETTRQCKHDANRTYSYEMELCLCKDTSPFKALEKAGEYLYPINVEFCLLAVEYILYFFFTAKTVDVIYYGNKPNGQEQIQSNLKNAAHRHNSAQATQGFVVLELENKNKNNPRIHKCCVCNCQRNLNIGQQPVESPSETSWQESVTTSFSAQTNGNEPRTESAEGATTNTVDGLSLQVPDRESQPNIKPDSIGTDASIDPQNIPVLANPQENSCSFESNSITLPTQHTSSIESGKPVAGSHKTPSGEFSIIVPSPEPTEHADVSNTENSVFGELSEAGVVSETTGSSPELGSTQGSFESDLDIIIGSMECTGETGESISRNPTPLFSSQCNPACYVRYTVLVLSCSVALVYLIFSVILAEHLNGKTANPGTISYLVFKLFYWIMTICIIWVGFFASRGFVSKHRGYSSFEMVILVCTMGIFINRFLSMFAAVSTLHISQSQYETARNDQSVQFHDIQKKSGFIVVISIMNILQVYMQTTFMFHAVSIHPHKLEDHPVERRRYDIYKYVLLYLIPFNATFWIVDSFTVLHPENLHSVQHAYFTASSYKLVMHIIFPFALFYRFNSTMHFLRLYLKTK